MKETILFSMGIGSDKELIKNGNKRSLKNYTDELLAKDHIERLKKTDSKNKYAIEIRPGESKRCEYCNVNKYCDMG